MMGKGTRIREVLTIENPDAIMYDNMDKALLGIYREYNSDKIVAVYSYINYIGLLIEQDGMTEEEAVEFFDYNVDGLHLGMHQPIVIDDTGV